MTTYEVTYEIESPNSYSRFHSIDLCSFSDCDVAIGFARNQARENFGGIVCEFADDTNESSQVYLIVCQGSLCSSANAIHRIRVFYKT